MLAQSRARLPVVNAPKAKSKAPYVAINPFTADVLSYYTPRARKLLSTPSGQHKYLLSMQGENAVYQVGLSLSPHEEARTGINFCAGASPECIRFCLKSAGENIYPSSLIARVRRSRLMMEHFQMFAAKLSGELDAARKVASKLGIGFAFRGNTLSDVDIWGLFGSLWRKGDRWLDYTKVQGRYTAWLARRPEGYHLTFSRSELNGAYCRDVLARGGTATVVVRDATVKARMLREGFEGFPAVDGDLHDRRWEDPAGHWVVLVAKGPAKKSCGGFVVD